jgi:metallopeptidase MepB
MSVQVPTNAEGNALVYNALALTIPPPSFDVTSTTILATARELIASSERLHDLVVQTVEPATATFDNTVLPIIHEENRLLCERQLIEFLASVSPSDEIRESARTAKRLFAEFDGRTSARQNLYDLILAVSGREECMTMESRHLLDKLLSEFSRQGLATTPEHQEGLQKIEAELSEIETEYLHNLQLAEHLEIRLAEEELEGVPERFRDASRNENCGNDPRVRLNLGERMQLLNLLGYVKSHKAREIIYREFVRHHQSNATLFERAIILRQRKAQILGHATYIEWSMATRMEKDPQKIVTFLQDLLTIVQPARDLIVGQWRMMKKEDLKALGEPDENSFYVWDRPYYTNRMMERAFSLNSDAVKEYFPLEHTASCMLGIFGHLFGLRFVNIDELADSSLPTKSKGLPTVWHEDVLVFAVWNSTDSDQEDTDFLGYLYMDLYRRSGKRPGFADLPICPVRTYLAIE